MNAFATLFRQPATTAPSGQPDKARAVPANIGRAGAMVLHAQQHAWLRPTAGWTVHVIKGCAWITQEGDIRDVVVSEGDCFTFDRDTPALLSALDDTRLWIDGENCPGKDSASQTGPCRGAMRQIPAHAVTA